MTATSCELFMHTHTNKNDEKTFIDRRSCAIYEKFMAIRKRPQSEGMAIDENNIYYEAVGVVYNRRVYGLDTIASQYYLEASHSQFGSANDFEERVQEHLIEILSDLEEGVEDQVYNEVEQRVQKKVEKLLKEKVCHMR